MKNLLVTLVELSGALLVVYGVWLIYEPAALIISGGLMVAAAAVWEFRE